MCHVMWKEPGAPFLLPTLPLLEGPARSRKGPRGSKPPPSSPGYWRLCSAPPSPRMPPRCRLGLSPVRPLTLCFANSYPHSQIRNKGLEQCFCLALRLIWAHFGGISSWSLSATVPKLSPLVLTLGPFSGGKLKQWFLSFLCLRGL